VELTTDKLHNHLYNRSGQWGMDIRRPSAIGFVVFAWMPE